MAEWEYLTIKELAGLLKLNQQTVRNWVNAGELEYVQFGRAKRIPRQVAVALAGGDGYEMPELLTVAEVAAVLRLNEQTIRNWIDAGTLPAVRMGRRVRVKQAVLDMLADSGLSSRAPQQPPAPSAREFWLGDRPVGEPALPS